MRAIWSGYSFQVGVLSEKQLGQDFRIAITLGDLLS